jgi:protein involved in polysaccharide export with SLBB domain
MIERTSTGRIIFLAAATIAFAFASYCRAQQLPPVPGPSSDGYSQRSQPCDGQYIPCYPSSNPQTQANPLSVDPTSMSPFPEADTRYSFGTGQPYNLSQPDYGQQYRAQPSMPSAPVRLKPEAPTEFQKFVAADIGSMLPIYGSQLFVNVPATFAPLDKVPVTPSYVIGPGDELLLRAWGSITFYLRETVDRSGNIYIPHVGQIQVSGIAFSEIRGYLTTRISSEFKKFELNVEMGQLRAIQVFVVGRTRRPGSYTVSSLSSLVNTLFVSGGPSNAGSMRRIQVRRGPSSVTDLDLYELLLNGDKSRDATLLPGDVVYIPPAGPRVAVTGSISQPAIYEIVSGETVGDALRMAGGLTQLAALSSGELERIDARGMRHVIEIRFDDNGVKTPLADGDILRVLSIVPRFDNAVTLRGNVANPGRYSWHAGMRIRDLIPDKESLLTRDYWKRKNDLIFKRFEDSPATASVGKPATDKVREQDDVSVPSPETDDVEFGTTTPTSTATSASQVLNPASAIPPQATNDAAAGTSQGKTTSGSGSIASQAGNPSRRFPVSNEVQLRVPEIDWDFAVIERMNADDLSTSLRPFNLGKLVLGGDQSENQELEPGDVITIFSQADIHVPQTRRTKFVRLEGEFKAAGVYSVRPGETLRQLVERCGGLTDQAYLFGSSFTRESTREQEQARLDEYTSDLEQEIDRAAANRSNSAVNVQEAASVSAGLESQRALAGKLKQLHATGRIVLDIAPGSADIGAIPDLPLEDGDSFAVPTKPSSVSVVGAVYDASSFVFESSRRATDYLQLAGGVTRNGDSKHAFIIRADGSVVSRKSHNAAARGGLEALSMNPGDAFVVPEQVNKTTLLRGLTDWSAVFSQFGLGVAAVNVLH